MIEIRNVTKSFGDKEVFRDFSLVIEDKDFVVLSGSSGCGKTTLLNMIGGLEKADKGEIIVDGFDVNSKKGKAEYYKSKIGFLFQNFALVENKTVKKNLEMVQKSARTDMSIEQVLELVGLSREINSFVYQLSGGEQQRIALARLMYKKCDIILADEPTGSLDSGNAKMVINFLHKMNEAGKTIVLVTHDETIINREENVIQL